MKKLFLILIVLAQIFFCEAFSALALDIRSEGNKENKSITGKTSKLIQKFCGLTWLGNSMASVALATVLKIKVGGKVSAKVKSASFTDLLAGKIKFLELRLTNSSYKGFPLGRQHIKASQPFQLAYFNSKQRKVGLVSPVLLTIEGVISEQDVACALKAPRVASSLNFLKLELPGLGTQHLQILQPKISFQGCQIGVKSLLAVHDAPVETAVPLEITARPYLQGDRFIIVKDVTVASTEIIEPQQFAAFVEDLLNPLVDLGKMDRVTHAVRLNSLTLDDSKIRFTARLLLAPKPRELKQPIAAKCLLETNKTSNLVKTVTVKNESRDYVLDNK